jgi:hypothetical protein
MNKKSLFEVKRDGVTQMPSASGPEKMALTKEAADNPGLVLIDGKKIINQKSKESLKIWLSK